MSYNISLRAFTILERLQICYSFVVNNNIDITNESQVKACLQKTYESKYGHISFGRLSDVMKEFLKQESFKREHPKLHSYRLWYLYYKIVYEEYILQEFTFNNQDNFMLYRYLFDKCLAMRCIKEVPYSSKAWKKICMIQHSIGEVSDRDKLNYIISLVLHSQPDAYEQMAHLDKLYSYDIFIPSDRAMKILIKQIMHYDKFQTTNHD